MSQIIEKTGKTIEEAIQMAIDELCVTRDEVEIDVLKEPSKKLFGLLGAIPAKVRVTVKGSKPSSKSSPEHKVQSENIDELLKAAENFLDDIIIALKLEAKFEIEKTNENYYLNIVGKDTNILIGKNGCTLDALQYILNLVLRKKETNRKIFLTLDVESYRKRRQEYLNNIVNDAVKRVIKTHKGVRIDSVGYYEQKFVNELFQKFKNIKARSINTGAHRYILVLPK